jgi:hypothetical protein
MDITRSSVDTVEGPQEWFTGDVCIDAVAAAPAPTRFLVHLALNEVDAEHPAADWGAHVTDAEYGAARA